jgi:hypothetical protein
VTAASMTVTARRGPGEGRWVAVTGMGWCGPRSHRWSHHVAPGPPPGQADEAAVTDLGVSVVWDVVDSRQCCTPNVLVLHTILCTSNGEPQYGWPSSRPGPYCPSPLSVHSFCMRHQVTWSASLAAIDKTIQCHGWLSYSAPRVSQAYGGQGCRRAVSRHSYLGRRLARESVRHRGERRAEQS